MRIANTVLAIALAANAVGACGSSTNEKTHKDVLMKSVTIPVDGMACDSCSERIQKNLTRIDGVLDATVSFENKYAVIQYDARKLDPTLLASAISGLGFKTGAPVEVAR
jgi:mercuric ion binding protein